MAEKVWQPIKVCFCEHIGQDVEFEAQLVFPSDLLSDQNPRVLAHRCSHGMACNQEERGSCIWAGTNPAIDPFQA
jgi:hypothetical protein